MNNKIFKRFLMLVYIVLIIILLINFCYAQNKNKLPIPNKSNKVPVEIIDTNLNLLNINLGTIENNTKRTPLIYSLQNLETTFETSIEKLFLKQEEMPLNITLAKISKMKSNPYIATSKNDFEKIAKEAFRNSIKFNNWRAVHTSFYQSKDLDDDTIFICIAIEYKLDTLIQTFNKDIELLKRYLKKETSDEYVLLEKFPFLIVIGANQNGEYEFNTVKEIADKFKIKLFGSQTKLLPTPIVYTSETNEVINPINKTLDTLESQLTNTTLETQIKSKTNKNQ